MSKYLSNLSYLDEYDVKEVMQGSSFAIMNAKNDRDLYGLYKQDNSIDISEYELEGMNVLSVLEKLGYPLEELGTYLYKEVIMDTYQELKKFNKNKDIDKAKELLKSLNDAYSNFYRWIASDYLEMGTTSFHLYIGRAIDRIKDEDIDQKLAQKIFGRNPDQSNYGIQAYKIASYLSKKYLIKYDKDNVKRLSNIPKDVKLKGEYV